MMKPLKKKRAPLSNLTVPLISLLLTLIVAAIILLILGKNPLTAFLGFLRGSGLVPKPRYGGGQGLLTDLFSFLSYLTPMIFASLGVMVAMRAGLFNIGVAGQMLLSAYVATALVGYSGLPAGVAMPLVLIIGVVVGGLLGAFIGFLKHRFNIHEVVTSIMVNYIVSYVTGFFINTRHSDPITRNSRPIQSTARLVINGSTGEGSELVRYMFPIGLILAILVVFLIRFILDRTTTGFRLKAVGQNQFCSRYAGIEVGRNVVLAMLISGVMAGLAGVTYYLGYTNAMVPKQLTSLGYDSIAVAVLGNVAPIGCLFASFIVTIFQKGSVYMSSTMEVPPEIASVITGVLLLFAASGTYIKEKLALFGRKSRNKPDEEEPNAKAHVTAKEEVTS